MITPKLIALFGATGTGKTTFINDASGEELQVGKTLEACTKEVTCSSSFQVDGENFTLIDTPGFDDTDLPDTDILKEIVGFLAATYESGHKLTGIIFLHRMIDNRVGGASRRTFNLFRQLCGSETLSNVVIVGNIYSNPPTPEEIEREKELQENPRFFQPALQEGARFAKRLSQGTDSAHDIIRLFIDKPPVVLNIQRQIVDNHQDLFETGAAKVLEEHLVKIEKRHQEEMQQLTEDLEKAKSNSAPTQSLKQELDEVKSELLRCIKQMESLRQGAEQEREMWRRELRDAKKKRKNAKRENVERENAKPGAQLAGLRQEETRAQSIRGLFTLKGIIATIIAAITMRMAEPMVEIFCRWFRSKYDGIVGSWSASGRA